MLTIRAAIPGRHPVTPPPVRPPRVAPAPRASGYTWYVVPTPPAKLA